MSGPKGLHLSGERREALRQALLENPNTPATEIGDRLNIGRTTAQAYARQMRKDGLLKPPPVSTSDLPPQDAAEVRDAAFWRRKATEADKRAGDAEHVLRELAGITKRQITIPKWTMPAEPKQGRSAGLIHYSDLHAGEVVRSEEIGGYNAYDPEVFKRRFRRFTAASMDILPRWGADTQMQGVVAAFNGDLISGDIHDELRRTNALTAHEQVALVTDEIAAALKLLADKFGHVMATFTPGNHGRNTEKTHAKRMAALSYDTMIGTIVARELATDDRITINIASGADLVFPLFGWTVLQTHGDSMGTGGGMGFAGPELPIVRGGKKIKLAGFAAGEHYDLILSAHYHTSSNPGSMLANGSMVGASEYSLRIRAVPEPPMQWLALIHERWGLRERLPVMLEDPKMPERPRVRVPAGMRA